jgi:hypothetical protein
MPLGPTDPTVLNISGMFNLSVLHVWFKTWMESPCMFNLDGNTLYVQLVCKHNIGIGYSSELIWQWKIDLSCPFTIHKHEINFSFRLIAVLFSN